MAEAVETFGRKLMEGAAGTADRVADACAWLVAPPGGMAPHDMGLEPARLVGGVPDGLSAAAVTAAAALDDSGMAAASRPEPVANWTPSHLRPVPAWPLHQAEVQALRRPEEEERGEGEVAEGPANGRPRTGWGSSPTPRRRSATP